jgi:beta-mannosidase
LSSVPVGFRFAYLVTRNDTDPEFRRSARGADGSGGHTMMLRVNGVPVLAAGSNVVPMDELEGRVTITALRNLVTNMARAHFTAVRIWGGGVYMPDVFYDALTEAGILVMHDLMYAGEHRPTADDLNSAEILHSIRRIGCQASLVVISSCNECGGGAGLYTTFAIPLVAREDDTRAVWPASPAHHGWAGGVSTLTGLVSMAHHPDPAKMGGVICPLFPKPKKQK